jgi:hypothetical protein
MHFDRRSHVFDFAFRHDPAVSAPTEIFVPRFQYAHGYEVSVSDGTFDVVSEAQTLVYRHGRGREVHEVRIRPRR